MGIPTPRPYNEFRVVSHDVFQKFVQFKEKHCGWKDGYVLYPNYSIFRVYFLQKDKPIKEITKFHKVYIGLTFQDVDDIFDWILLKRKQGKDHILT